MELHVGKTLYYILLGLLVLINGVLCQEQVIKYTIREEVPTNTFIGNIGESLGIADTSGLQFDFLSTTAPHRSLFSLCCEGELRTHGRIDRDALCPEDSRDDVCSLSIDVTVRDDDTFYIAKVLVDVEDVEDNSPLFPKPRHVLNLSESTQLLASFALPTATDSDATTLTYSLTPSLAQFELEVSENECHLIVKQSLDREENARYSLQLRARDPASNIAILEIEVNVLDVNDNAPRFEQEDYDVYVFENAAVGSTLLQVHATDPDDGANGAVSYSLSTQSQTHYAAMFRVEALTGQLILLQALNYGERSEYTLRVVAEDQATSSLAAYTSITVHVRDLNDHAPQIHINALTPVPEHASVGTFVAHVQVTDLDGAENGQFECSLNHSSFSLEKLFPTEYKLITAAMLDRELQALYQVRMLCTDLGTPPLESSHTLSIEVEDINDHAPQFEEAEYEVSVSEDTALGTSLLTVRAQDEDIGENGRITYSLRGACTTVIAMDERTGGVTLQHALDHEERTVWTCQIEATDHNTQRPLSTTSSLRVIVGDVNDEAPRFPAASMTLSIRENQPAGTVLGDVVAYDRDAPPYNILTYHLASPSAYFRVESNTGTVHSTQPLDREETDTYTIYIVAEDAARLSSQLTVTILVQDMNDQAPVLLTPHTALQVSASARVSDIVTHVRATDGDTSNNAQLRYSITASRSSSSSRDSRGLFSINPLTGEVSVAQPLHDHMDENINLTVQVNDRGEPPLHSSTDLYIYINGSTALGASQESTSFNIIIVVLSVTVVLIVLLIAVVVFLIRRRRQQKQTPQQMVTVELSNNHNGAINREMEKPTVDDDQVKDSPAHHSNGGPLRPVSRPVSPPRLPSPHHPAQQHERIQPLTNKQLKVYNELHHNVPHADHHNVLPVHADGESDRGSSDSGRGGSEEENQNLSHESLPPARPSLQQPPPSRADCKRHSQHRGQRDHYPGTAHHISPVHTSHPTVHTPHPVPPVPKRSCKLHGHLAAPQYTQQQPQQPQQQQQQQQQQHNNIPRVNTTVRQTIPNLPPRQSLSAKPTKPAPTNYNMYTNQSMDTSVDGYSDGGSSTSGEYVIDLDEGAECIISKDIMV